MSAPSCQSQPSMRPSFPVLILFSRTLALTNIFSVPVSTVVVLRSVGSALPRTPTLYSLMEATSPSTPGLPRLRSAASFNASRVPLSVAPLSRDAFLAGVARMQSSPATHSRSTSVSPQTPQTPAVLTPAAPHISPYAASSVVTTPPPPPMGGLSSPLVTPARPDPCHLQSLALENVAFATFEDPDDGARQESVCVETLQASAELDASGDLWSLNQYSVVANLGEGASGVVYLVELLPEQRHKNPCRRSTSLSLSIGGMSAVGRRSLLEPACTPEQSPLAAPTAPPTEFALKAIPRHKVLKLLNDECSANEVAMMKQLAHPHVVTLHEVIDDALHDKLYLVMDYVEAGAIAEVDPNSGACQNTLNAAELESFVLQPVSALPYGPSRGIVHGDYKLENVLYTGARGAYLHTQLADFGVASLMTHAMDASTTFSESLSSPLRGGVVVGTPYARAPEMWSGASISEAADVWAFGVALHAVAFGVLPFRGVTLSELSYNVAQPLCTAPPHADPLVAERWWPTIAPLLQHDPRHRLAAFQTLAESLGVRDAPVSSWRR